MMRIIRSHLWFAVWQRALVGVSAFLMVFGVVAAVAPFALSFDARNAAIAEHFLGGSWTDATRDLHAFSSGPLGGTMAGFFLIQAIVAAVPLARRERWSWWSIAACNVLWFVVDSSVCAVHGAWFNIVQVNLVSGVLVAVPMLALVPSVFMNRE